MPAPRNKKHIVVADAPRAEAFRPHGLAIEATKPKPPPSRPAHAKTLRGALATAGAEAAKRRAAASAVHGVVPGMYITFDSQPDVALQVASLEDARQGIEVVAVTETMSQDEEPKRIEHATVFVPDGKVKHFLKRFAAYANTAHKEKGERRYEDMLDRVAALQLATLRALWTDSAQTYPGEHESIWWEVWLRSRDGGELERLMEFADAQQITVAARRLKFDDRIVTLVHATPAQLASSIDVLNDFAELRKAKEAASLFVDMDPDEQSEWAMELRTRVLPPSGDAPAVCVLDTGVTQAHPLLLPALDLGDVHTIDPAWGGHDNDGHGTEMSGLALFGDLTPVLASSGPVPLKHRLESVKILPPDGYAPNEPELYGALTAVAAGRVEIQAPTRRRTFSMAISATDERDRGQPTSWSAAVDALAAGRSFDPSTSGLTYLDDGDDVARRLFVLCAGNIDSLSANHLDRSDTEAVHDPGQAWNALTVGAMTEKAVITAQEWANWQPVALAGELSPWSTTGVTFGDPWPLKPDVVFEGGNVVKNASGEVDHPCHDLCLLSTYFKPAQRSFVGSWATSAATAQAARFAALISAEYPSFWPETLRALIVHSAEWSAQMQTHLRGAGTKGARARLVQRYGFGVPSLDRALRSASDALTLVAQNRIRPFKDGKLGDLHFVELPWPRDALLALGTTPVRLRVTLSYFIEPNPGRRGWKKRHSYASHGLRFEVKGPNEGLAAFRKRLNKNALEGEEKKPPADAESSEWYLGPQARNRGSIHSDMFRSSAADLAERGVIAIYPVGGWWKEQHKRDRSDKGARYALVVSIETPTVDTDIWTPVAEQVGVLVEAEH